MAKETDFEHPPRGHVAVLYYDVANNRFQVVQGDDVDAAIPATAKAPLASTLAHGYDGSAWRKLNLLWGYYARWVEQVYVENAIAGINVLATAVVPAGYVYRLDGITTHNANNVCNHGHDVILGNLMCRLAINNTVAAGVVVPTFPIGSVLAENDYARGVLTGCTLNDDLLLRVWGVKMRIDM